MPRGKYLNHKGRSRQFTPVEELQRERELEVCIMSSQPNKFNESASSIDSTNDGESSSDSSGHGNGNSNNSSNGITKSRKLGGAVEGLIEISNPNRPAKKSQKLALLTEDTKGKGKTIEDSLMEQRRRERAREKPRSNSYQKTVSEANADLARLALVRKKREAAAELRLAAKKESNSNYHPADGSTPSPSKPELSNKKKNKNKSVLGTNEFLKKPNNEETAVKAVRGRHANKRNVNLQA